MMPSPASAASTGTPITFAQGAAVQQGSFTGLLVATLLLVGLCVGLWFVRRRGYLQRWVGAPMGLPIEGVRVVQRMRLGVHAHVFVIEDGSDRWMVVEGRQGVLIPPGDASALAHAIEHAVRERPIAERVGVRDEWAAIGAATRRVYESVLEVRGRVGQAQVQP